MNISYREAVEVDLKTILEISHQEFGKEYLSQAELKEYLENEKTYLPVVLRENEVIGYSIIHKFTKKELLDFLKADGLSSLLRFSSDDSFQVRKTTAIKNEYVGRGIGREFIRWTMKTYSEGCKYIISINWKRGNEIPMRSISEQMGMREFCEIRNYWMEDSIQRKYDCPECGQPPCTCSAVLFLKKV